MNDAQAVADHQPHAQDNAARNVPRRGQGRGPLVIAQRVPNDARRRDVTRQTLARDHIGPIFSLLKTNKMNTPAIRQALEVGQHLGLPQGLQHAVIANIKNMSHLIPIPP